MSKTCSSCGAGIDWALTLTTGSRMPVDHDPAENGNLAVWDDGGVLRCRTLRKGEAPGPGEERRASHFAHCPDAMNHRRNRR